MLPKTSFIVVGVFVLLTVIYFCAVGCAVPGQTPPGLLTSCSTSPSQWRRTGRKRTESWNLSWYTLNSVNSWTQHCKNCTHIGTKMCTSTNRLICIVHKNMDCKRMPNGRKIQFSRHNIVKSVEFCYKEGSAECRVTRWRVQVTGRSWFVCDLLLELLFKHFYSLN